MRNRAQQIAQAAVIAALYAILTHLQNLLLPGSSSLSIQMRLSEALCVFAFFTPAAASGLAVGCFLFNLTFSSALPLDFLVGPAATWLAAKGMWSLRNLLTGKLPLAGLLMPALCNAILVGLELTACIGGAFRIHALYVFAGEIAVMMTIGVPLYLAVKNRKLDIHLFKPRK